MVSTALYPGSFDPPTLGHLDLLERAARLFGSVTVAVGENAEKAPFLQVEDRVAVLRECTGGWPGVEVVSFRGLLVDFARERGCTTVVRGLRAVSDFEYEARVAMANRRLAPEVETVFLFTRDEFSFLASSVVREVARLGGDYRGFVPEPVARLLANRGYPAPRA
jgi:pantetheine-phosphate adenylyltransferase